MIFKDRAGAAKLLAEEIRKLNLNNPIIMGIPRGGVVTAGVIARELEAPLDIIIARKLGVPGHEELGFGAIAPQKTLVLNEEIVKNLSIKTETIKAVQGAEEEELKRRLSLYRGSDNYTNLAKKDVVLVDDGVATGITILAALKFLKKKNPKQIIVVAPVCPPDTAREIEKQGSTLFLDEPNSFYAVGQFYQEFPQLDDSEVIAVIKQFKK